MNGIDPTGLDGFDDGDGGAYDFDPFLAECGGPSDPYGGMPIPPGASYPVSIPTSIAYPVNDGRGFSGSLDVNLTNGSLGFQFDPTASPLLRRLKRTARPSASQ